MIKELILDHLSPRQFEEFVAQIYQKKGYKHVHVTNPTGDEGKDIIMESPNDAITYIVECKHHKTNNIGRPVIQKLHSAVLTHDTSHEKRGIVVTSSFFSDEAISYAEDVGIELIDAHGLRQLASSVGLILKNSRIEIVTKETLPIWELNEAKEEVLNSLSDVGGINDVEIVFKESSVSLLPCYLINYRAFAYFKTKIMEHTIDETGNLLFDAASGEQHSEEILRLFLEGKNHLKPYSKISGLRMYPVEFRYDENGLRERAIDIIKRLHSCSVKYNSPRRNRIYVKECILNRQNINLCKTLAAYIPFWAIRFKIVNNTYRITFFQGKNSFEFKEDTTLDCHKGHKIQQSRSVCNNCGIISCDIHTKRCRYCSKYRCSNCIVEKSFMFSLKSFCDNHCLQNFEIQYLRFSWYEKLKVNQNLYSLFVYCLIVLGGILLALLWKYFGYLFS